MGNDDYRILLAGDPFGSMGELQMELQGHFPSWDIQLFQNEEDCLRELSSTPPQVVVTEWCGLSLLRRIQQDFPSIPRLVLLREEEMENSSEATAYVHRYLPFPCTPEIFARALEDVLQNGQGFENERLKALIAQIGEFPSPPASFSRMLKLLNDPQTSMESLVIIIEHDPSVAAKVMQVANSAFFGFSSQVTSVRDALPLLGFHLVKGIVLVKEAFQKFPKQINGGIVLDDLWAHSVRTGIFASDLVLDHYKNRPMADEAFASALLHDFGKLILQAALGEGYVEILKASRTQQIPLWQVEIKQCGVSHADAGAYLLQLWGLADSLVRDVRFHHQPGLSGQKQFTSLTALHLADRLEHLESGNKLPHFPGELEVAYLRSLGVSERIEDWKME